MRKLGVVESYLNVIAIFAFTVIPSHSSYTMLQVSKLGWPTIKFSEVPVKPSESKQETDNGFFTLQNGRKNNEGMKRRK